MKTKSTTLFIAVAAFAVTVTSVQAFGNQAFLTRAGLTDEQVVAIQEARELRVGGDLAAARDVLIEAGIDEEVIDKLRTAHTQRHNQHKQHLLAQLTDDQYEALFVARQANDKEAVRAILEEAGLQPRGGMHR